MAVREPILTSIKRRKRNQVLFPEFESRSCGDASIAKMSRGNYPAALSMLHYTLRIV